jgi:hypothetical protein
MKRDADRVLEDAQAVMHEIRHHKGRPIQISYTLASTLAEELQWVREEMTRLRQEKRNQNHFSTPRSIYILEAADKESLETLQDVDFALVLEDAGYKQDNLHGPDRIVTDAIITKNRFGESGGTITIYENWPE